jgi:hypothetical protein
VRKRQLESEQGGELMIRNPAWMAAGATMGFRASFKPALFPIEPGWTHDTWIRHAHRRSPVACGCCTSNSTAIDNMHSRCTGWP